MENINMLAEVLEHAGFKTKMKNEDTLIVFHPYKTDIGTGQKWSRAVHNASRIFNPKAVMPICEFKATIISF